MSAKFQASTSIRAGLGSLSETARVFQDLGASRIVVVADRGLSELGILASSIDRTGVRCQVVETVLADVNPSVSPVIAAAERARSVEADAVLGIGGGSGLGMAKAVALAATNDVPLASLEGVGRATRGPLPLVAIPTTAGSGSEVSNALVLHEPGRVRELVIRGAGYEPVAAILDAEVLRDLPRTPLTHAALDALTHALEALWARGRSAFTDACALHAASEILETLPLAAAGASDGRNADGQNDAVLQRLLEASSLANLACGNSGLALVHALSSSPAVLLAHGLQNGVLLPAVAAFNRGELSASSRAIADRIPDLYEQIGFAPKFSPGAADAEAMIQASTDHAFRLNNARASSDDELRHLLAEVGAAARPATATIAKE